MSSPSVPLKKPVAAVATIVMMVLATHAVLLTSAAPSPGAPPAPAQDIAVIDDRFHIPFHEGRDIGPLLGLAQPLVVGDDGLPLLRAAGYVVDQESAGAVDTDPLTGYDPATVGAALADHPLLELDAAAKRTVGRAPPEAAVAALRHLELVQTEAAWHDALADYPGGPGGFTVDAKTYAMQAFGADEAHSRLDGFLDADRRAAAEDYLRANQAVHGIEGMEAAALPDFLARRVQETGSVQAAAEALSLHLDAARPNDVMTTYLGTHSDLPVSSDPAGAAQAYAASRGVPVTQQDLDAFAQAMDEAGPEWSVLVATVLASAAEAETLARQSVEAWDGVGMGAAAASPDPAATLAALRDEALGDQAAALLVAAAQFAGDTFAGMGTTQASAPAFTFPPDASPSDALFVVTSSLADEIDAAPALLIDAGGDDLYTAAVGASPDGVADPKAPGNVGGGDPTAPSVHFALDLEGDDRHLVGGEPLALWGTALPGRVAVFADMQGNDHYEYLDGQNHWAFGAGVVGTGVFLDDGGDDTYIWRSDADRDDIDIEHAGAFGYSFDGTGLFIEGSGDDLYDIWFQHSYASTFSNPSTDHFVGTLGASEGGGQGVFVEQSGDDRYRLDHTQGYTGFRYESVSLGAAGDRAYSQSNSNAILAYFHDVRGDDTYAAPSTLYLTQYDSTLRVLGIMLDTAGNDTYHGGFYQRAHPESGIAAGTTYLIGDAEVVQAAPLDVEARITAPRVGGIVRLDAPIDFRIAARNHAGEALPVTGTFGVYGVDGNGIIDMTAAHVQEEVDFGLVDAGGESSLVVSWDGLDEDAQVIAMLRLDVADEHAGNNQDMVELRIDDLFDLRLRDLQIAPSPAAPGGDLQITATLANHGNMDIQGASIQLTVEDGSGGAATVVATDQHSLAAPAPVVTDGVSSTKLLTFQDVAPGQEAERTYRLRILSPGSHNEVCPTTCTQLEQDLEVVVVEDAVLSQPWRRYASPAVTDISDVALTNAGNVELDLPSLERTVELPSGDVLVETLDPPALGVGASWQPDFTPLPAELTGTVRSTYEAPLGADLDPSDNTLAHTVHLGSDYVYGDDMEDPANPGVLSTGSDGPLWERGIDQGDPQSPGSGGQHWVTALDAGYGSGRDGRLTFTDVDTSDFTIPQLRFLSRVETVQFSTSAYGGGTVSLTDQAGAEHRLVPDGGYPCKQPLRYTSQPLETHTFCSSASWEEYTIDLSAFDGQVVDIHFDWWGSTSYSYYEGWFLDDVVVTGVPRLPFDVAVTGIDVEPVPHRTDPVGLAVEVTNYGVNALDTTLVVDVGVGTRPMTQARSIGLGTLEAGESVVVETDFLPQGAKTHNVRVRAATDQDNNTLNNAETVAVDVFDVLSTDDLESGAPGWGAGSQWELGEPSVFPFGAASGSNAFTTNADGNYATPGFSANHYDLDSPTMQVPTTGVDLAPGDVLGIAFSHARDLVVGVYGVDYPYYNDIAYVTAAVNGGSHALAEPVGGYPHQSGFYSGSPRNNPDYVGWAGRSEGYQTAVVPLDVKPGDSVDARFTLHNHYYSIYSSFTYPDGPKPGWTIDDVSLARMPRFDHDAHLEAVTPYALDVGETVELEASVANQGRKPIVNAQLVVDIAWPDGSSHTETVDIEPIPIGGRVLATAPVDVPMLSGEAAVEVRVAYTAEEMDLDNTIRRQVVLGRILERASFEDGRDGWTDLDDPPYFQRREPDHVLGGRFAWTSPQLGKHHDGAIRGPAVPLEMDGVTPRETQFIAGISWPWSCSVPSAGWMMGERVSGDVLQPDGPLGTAYLVGPNAVGRCGAHNGPVTFPTSAHMAQPAVQPQFLIDTYSSAGAGRQAVFDEATHVAIPWDQNVQITGFTSPRTGLLGPGEGATIKVNVGSGGLAWPDAPIAVGIRSNDIGPGGAPTLDAIVPVRILGLGEQVEAAADWVVPEALDGQSVTLSAQLLRREGAQWVPLVDDNAADNAVSLRIDVIGIHDLRVETTISPSLSPHDVVPVSLAAAIHNDGTRTEDNVELRLEVHDEDGGLVHTFTTPPVQVRPAFAAAPTRVQETWTPPAPGHYRYTAGIEAPTSGQDVTPDNGFAQGWIHSGTLPFRMGDHFDGDDRGWQSEGGVRTSDFRPADAPDAPDGSRILVTAPDGEYSHDTRYIYDMHVDLSQAGAPEMSFRHARSLGSGDDVQVMVSAAHGPWETLYGPVAGSAGWQQQTIDLADLAGAGATMRFVMTTDGGGRSDGWRIDDIRVRDGGAVLWHESFESPHGEVLEAWDFDDDAQAAAWSHQAGHASLDDWEHGVPAASTGVRAPTGEKLWGTNLAGSYATAQVGVVDRELLSPAINLPGDGEITFTWMMMYEFQTWNYRWCSISSACGDDIGRVHVEVSEGGSWVRHDAEPAGGYPARPFGQGSAFPWDRAWVGASPWIPYTLDLSEHAGGQVRIVFTLRTPYNSEFYRGRATGTGIDGPDLGMYIDDPAVLVRPVQQDFADAGGILAAEPEDILTTGGGRLAVTLAGGPTQGSEGSLAWRVIGRGGGLVASGSDAVQLSAGQETTYPLELPDLPGGGIAVELDLDIPGDGATGNNRLLRGFDVLEAVYTTDFETDAPCMTTQPCLGWTHSHSDTPWEHGPIPEDYFPPEAASGDMVFSTGLSGDGKYQSYESNYLRAPTVTGIPPGSMLRFKSAIDADAYSGFYKDGTTLYINGQYATPEGGYQPSTGDCYYVYVACFSGRSEWQTHTVPLDRYGDTVSTMFRFTSYCCTPGDWGFTLDDFHILAPPQETGPDVALGVPASLVFDPKYAEPVTVEVANRDDASSGSLRLHYRLVDGAQQIGEGTVHIGGLGGGEARRVALPITTVTQPARLEVALQRGDGSWYDDFDPGNNVASTDIAPGQIAYRLPAPSGPAAASPGHAPFRAVSDPAITAGSGAQQVLATGLDDDYPGASSMEIHGIEVPRDATLQLRHRYDFSYGDGGVVEARIEGATWEVLQPREGGYVGDRFSCLHSSIPIRHACFTGDQGWHDTTFELPGVPGQVIDVRFRTLAFFPDAASGWAIAGLEIHGAPAAYALEGDGRWRHGGLDNPRTPVEEASQPAAWGTGLDQNTARPRGYDVLVSPPIDMSGMVGPSLGFDYFLDPEFDRTAGAPPVGAARLAVQMRDAGGNWFTIAGYEEPTPGWLHAQLPVPEMDGTSQLRFLYAVQANAASNTLRAGAFVDNVLVGSLQGDVDVLAPLPFDVDEGQEVTLPVEITNTGVYPNEYRLDLRGPTPYWRSEPTAQTYYLEPGQSAVGHLAFTVPFVPKSGLERVQVLARSTFDPLMQGVGEMVLDIDAAPKPDLRVNFVSFDDAVPRGDGSYAIREAIPNIVIAHVENVGKRNLTDAVTVQFYEIHGSGDDEEWRPLRAPGVEADALVEPSSDEHRVAQVKTDWFPRKSVTGIAAVVNGEALVAPVPRVPDSNPADNLHFQPVDVLPRALPELELKEDPSFTPPPQVDEVTRIGLDVRNAGSVGMGNQVDVATLVDYEDATLTSPPRAVPSNSFVHMRYTSDLEEGADGVQVDARVGGGEWQTLEPLGGYSHGCIISLGCKSAISGTANGRTVTLPLQGMEGDMEFRLRFAMDSHNGRTYEGFQVHSILVEQFGQTVTSFDFANGRAGWSAGPDLGDSTLWTYQPREGPLPGGWQIGRGYTNPYLVGLQQLDKLAPGDIGHVESPWLPGVGGTLPALVYVDPKNLEPEFGDDINRFERDIHVVISDFSVDVDAGACPNICLDGHDDQVTVPVTLRNTGNARSVFDVAVREEPSFGTALTYSGATLDLVDLGVGESIVADLSVQGLEAAAGRHTLYFKVQDTATSKVFDFAVPVDVEARLVNAEMEHQTFQLARSTSRLVTIENPSNAAIDVLLRAAGDPAKPPGLAVSMTPGEFSLAPFEERVIEMELFNLGVTAGAYDMRLENMRIDCECDERTIGTFRVDVAKYNAPVVAITASAESVGPAVPVTFSHTAELEGSEIQDLHWAFGDGTTSREASPSHAYQAPGIYQVTLHVTDTEGQRVESQPVTVAVVNNAPTIHVEPLLPTEPVAGEELNFSAYRSVDEDGGIAKVIWAFGDGTVAEGLNVTHKYSVGGTYRVTVAVEDVFGAVDVESFDLEVAGLPGSEGTLGQTGGDGKESPGLALPFLLAMVLAAAAVVWRRRP